MVSTSVHTVRKRKIKDKENKQKSENSSYPIELNVHRKKEYNLL
jgi:hypothetical protein